MAIDDADRRWLAACVRIARPWLGTTAENPTVGAMVMDKTTGALLGRGVTAPGGRPHAEPQALAEAGERARGATLYVTLEPCNHHGRTPPCVDAIIAAGIARVVIGMLDPDPRTAGQGLDRLRAAGIAVEVAEFGPATALHEGFVTRMTRGRSFVTAKLAVSADGMIGRRGEANVPVTGPLARRWTFMQRAFSDAVMVGGATADIDDPSLTVRLRGLEHRQPRRLVLLGSAPLRAGLRLFSGPSPSVALVPPGTSAPQGAIVWALPAPRDLRGALTVLGQHGISRLFVEPGARLAAALLAARLVDRFELLGSPVVIGGNGLPAALHGSLEAMLERAGLRAVDHRDLGDDKLTTFERA